MLLRSLLRVTHPFEAISPRRKRNLFIALLLLTCLVYGVGYFIGAPLETAAAPSGLRSLELSGDPIVSTIILQSWDTPNQLRASFLLGLDCLLLLLGTTALGLACIWAGDQFDNKWLNRSGVWLAWCQWAANLPGILGDAATAAILFGQRGSFWPQQAKFEIEYKFYLLSLGFAFVLLGAVQNVASAIYGRSSPAPQKRAA